MGFYQYIGPIGCASRGRYKDDGGTEQHIEVRKDNKSNAITTTTTDSMICQPIPIRVSKQGGGDYP